MLLFLRVGTKSEIKAQVLGYPSQRNEKYYPLKINNFFFSAKACAAQATYYQMQSISSLESFCSLTLFGMLSINVANIWLPFRKYVQYTLLSLCIRGLFLKWSRFVFEEHNIWYFAVFFAGVSW